MRRKLRDRRLRAAWIVVLVSIVWGDGRSAAIECEMAEVVRHNDAGRTRIYAANAGRASLYFRSDLDVNTDGAARSYHPDDPRGKTRALNNMGNALTKIFDQEGRDVTCSPRRGACFNLLISTFEQARDAGYSPGAHPRVETKGIIPWRFDARRGWKVPCTIPDGPSAGFFVSQTSLEVDRARDECDQRRYLDSLSFNAIVLPRNVSWRSQGVATDEGDLVVVRDIASGRIAYAITGDRGPAQALGEGTVALAASLANRNLEGDETYQQIKTLARPDVQYVIFPMDDIRRIMSGPFTQQDVNDVGERLFSDWGGGDRLDACADLAR